MPPTLPSAVRGSGATNNKAAATPLSNNAKKSPRRTVVSSSSSGTRRKQVDMNPNNTPSVFSYLTQAGSAARMDTTNSELHSTQADVHVGGGDGKVRALEDFIRKFPIDTPNNAPSIHIKNTSTNMNTSALKGTSKQAALEEEIRKFEREAQTKKEGKEVAKTTFSHFRKQKIDAWLSIAERNNRKIRKENEALEQMAHLAQEGCIDNDAKYSEAIDALRSDLELATLVRQDNSETIKNVNQSVGLIQDCIEDVCETAKQQVQLECSNLQAAFERQVERQDVRLAEVKESGKSTTEEWRVRNQQVQEELLATLTHMEELHDEKSGLQRIHQTLKVNYEAQATDSETLEITLKAAARHHQSIKGRIRALEVQIAASTGGSVIRPQSQEATIIRGGSPPDHFSGGGSSSRPPVAPKSGSAADQKKQQEFDRALQHAQELLETEAANLKTTRLSHTKALKERSELEVFLRQAILLQRQAKAQRIREGTAARPFITQSPVPLDDLTELVFDPKDRKGVIERVLSQERVMQLLFQTEEELTEQDKLAQEEQWEARQAEGHHAVKRTTGHEVEGLWDRWKNWVLQANEALSNHNERSS